MPEDCASRVSPVSCSIAASRNIICSPDLPSSRAKRFMPVLLLPVILFVMYASPYATTQATTHALTQRRPATRADTSDCAAGAAFLRDTQRMVAVVERDTIDDWRTKQRVAGCRITAAGATELTVQREAVRFYERVRAAGWTRTSDPRDAPHEASLRFRMGPSDCLFNVNAQALLATRAESKVNRALKLNTGETRYQVLALCMPAMDAK
jgi:hypothetical protein